jgi:membrane protease YdiL (CAAX protease family)
MSGFRLPSWPVWLIFLGVGLVAVAAASLIYTSGPGVFATPGLLRPGVLTPQAAALLALGVLGALVSTVGMFAFVVAGSVSRRRAERGYASLGTILACLGVAIVLANVLAIPFALIAARQDPSTLGGLTPFTLVLSVVTLDGSLLGVVYLRIVRPRVLTWEQMGLRIDKFGTRFAQGIGVGFLCLLGALGVELILKQLGVVQTQEELFTGFKNASLGQFVGVFLAGATIVPVCEEIFFRGYVFTAVRQRYGLAQAFVLSPVLFAAAHLNLPAFLPILAAGVLLGYVYYRTGSLVPSMVAHGVFNGLQFLALYFGPS